MPSQDRTTPLDPALWVAATPIGNPADLSARAREVLGAADVIFAEDTRRTGLLLAECGVERSGSMASLHEHNEEGRINGALDALSRGLAVALVSDAGTPLMSDPGYRLVRAVREAGYPVRPVPGPSAVLSALSVCGLPPYPFVFLGFPPRKQSRAEAFFEPWKDVPATLVLFERKDRVARTLASALAVLGDRECCIAREMTKTHEEFLFDSLSGFQKQDLELLGEATLVIGPPGEREVSEEDVLALARAAMEEGLKPKQAAKIAAQKAPGWTAKAVYEKMSHSS